MATTTKKRPTKSKAKKPKAKATGTRKAAAKKKPKTAKLNGAKTNGRAKANGRSAKAKAPAKLSKAEKARIEKIFAAQKEHAIRLRSSTASERKAKLQKLLKVVQDYQTKVHEALYEDFRKSPTEVDITELLLVIGECREAIRHVKKWMKPKKVKTPMTMMRTKSRVEYEPKGVCLIIAPWNYPFQLAIAPLIAAIAAGNTVMIKPSEMTPHTSALLKEMLEVFPEEEVAVIEGAGDTAAYLTNMMFDHIFFTGSTPVGKLVMQAAAKNLTSVTLELGGKSPVIVDDKMDLSVTASRVIWGKIFNAGQTCVAPDYLMIPENRVGEFVEEAKKATKSFLGTDPQNNPDFCRIVNDRHQKRIKGLVDEAVKGGAKVEFGGDFGDDNYIAPTVITNVKPNQKIMTEEIFGPVLPIVPYTSLDEAINFVNEREKPLALYVFSKDGKIMKRVLRKTTAGGTLQNDVIVHLANGNLPFGGVNHSGIGNYHGEFGFKAFSHERAFMQQAVKFSSISMMYPPYNKYVKKMVDLTLKYIAGR